MANGAMKDQYQQVNGALEKNNNWKIKFLPILSGYTTKKCAMTRNSLNSQSVK